MLDQAGRYYSRFQTARGGWTGLPPLARSTVLLFALPGIALLVLSILLGLVSLFVLLLLTVPVYRMLLAVFGSVRPKTKTVRAENPFASMLFGQMAGGWGAPAESPGRKHVDAKVVDAKVVDATVTETD